MLAALHVLVAEAGGGGNGVGDFDIGIDTHQALLLVGIDFEGGEALALVLVAGAHMALGGIGEVFKRHAAFHAPGLGRLVRDSG